MLVIPVVASLLIFGNHKTKIGTATTQPSSDSQQTFMGLSYDEAENTFGNARKAIESLMNQRTLTGKSRQEIENAIKAQSKDAHFEYVLQEKLPSYQGLTDILLLMGYQRTAYRDVLVVKKPFWVKGQLCDSTSAFLFDSHGKMTKARIIEMFAHPTIDEVKAMLHKDIPIGASRMQVESWLKSRKIWRAYLDAKKSDISEESDVQQSKHRAAELSGFTRASLPYIGMTYPVIWSHHLLFFYGKSGKLRDYVVRTIGSGP